MVGCLGYPQVCNLLYDTCALLQLTFDKVLVEIADYSSKKKKKKDRASFQ